MRRKIAVTETCLGLGRGGVRNNTAFHNYSLVTQLVLSYLRRFYKYSVDPDQ